MKPSVRSLSQLTCFIWVAVGIATCALAASDEIGITMNVEGSFSAKGTDGVLRKLAVKDKVLSGDTLFTGKDSYARVKFSDGGQISLRPSTQFKVEKYNFDEQQPGKDAANFNLLKGAMRSISGLVGKRGDPDSYSVKTREATAGIRGTKFGVRLCQGDCGDVPLPADGTPIADGAHFDVLEGTIIVKNSAGSQLLNAGQFGYVGNISTPPIEIPADHAVRVEMPPKISLDNIRGAAVPAASANDILTAIKSTDSKGTAKSNTSGNGTPAEKKAEASDTATGDAGSADNSSTPNACPK